MKKIVVLVVALAMILSFAAVAYGTDEVVNGRQFGYTNRVQRQFVDEDGDGICDNTGLRAGNGMRNGFIDEDGDGICDNGGFIDEDGDGICDNCTNGGVPARNGSGRQYGRQGRQLTLWKDAVYEE